jgi:integral membrane sensor domain MASE1
MVWPLWPGCALLVAVLLLIPRKIWPIAIVAGLAGFVLYDVRAGLPLRSTALLILADVVEVLIAVGGVSYSFDGVPRLDSIKALAKYSFFAVVLAPLSTAFAGAAALGGIYWITWRIAFLTEALAFLTLTPAILSCAGTKQAWSKRPRTYYLEAAALFGGLAFVGLNVFVTPGMSSPPALLYSIVPFLRWSALRFGVLGTSTSMIVIAFLPTWGAVHGLGPFTGSEPLRNVLSLQLFLLFVATPFMVLAALIEERLQADKAVRESENRVRLMADIAPVMIWMSGSDKIFTYFNKPWLDFTGQSTEELGSGWSDGVHPEDLRRRLDTYIQSFDGRLKFRMEYRIRRWPSQYQLWRFMLVFGPPHQGMRGRLLLLPTMLYSK